MAQSKPSNGNAQAQEYAPRALGYVRVSSDRQERSPDAQEKIIREVSGQFGPLVIYRETESALKKPVAMREEGKRMLSEARAGDTIIICDIDRLGANTLDLLSVLAWLDDHRIVVYDAVIRERIELKTPEGMMLNGIRCLWAQVERMRMGQRIKRVLDFQREHGLPWHGRPRYGFRRQRAETGGKRRATWVRDEREWQLMAEIYELRQHKGWKFKDIVALFANRGEMTADTGPMGAKGQKPWDYWRVYRAFRLYKKLVEEGHVAE